MWSFDQQYRRIGLLLRGDKAAQYFWSLLFTLFLDWDISSTHLICVHNVFPKFWMKPIPDFKLLSALRIFSKTLTSSVFADCCSHISTYSALISHLYTLWQMTSLQMMLHLILGLLWHLGHVVRSTPYPPAKMRVYRNWCFVQIKKKSGVDSNSVLELRSSVVVLGSIFK